MACVHDVATGRLAACTCGHRGYVNAVAFSPDGRKPATSTDGSIRVWDAATGRPLTENLVKPVDRMLAAVFSPDGKRVLGRGREDS